MTENLSYPMMISRFNINEIYKILLSKNANFLIKNELIKNIYIFQSFYKLKNQGTNNSSPNIIKKIKLKNQISVNLFGDQIYKEKI